MQKLAEVLALQRETPEECIPGESVGCGEKISASAPPPPFSPLNKRRGWRCLEDMGEGADYRPDS